MTAAIADTIPDRRRRARMVRDQLTECSDDRVIAAMAIIPRHAFVPPEQRQSAYDDHAQAIGAGQTISQPRIVARMLAKLAIQPGDQVLDVGAGSGYTAALLAHLCAPGHVVALERQSTLISATRRRLRQLAPTVELRHADGLAELTGMPRFDVIHVGAACLTIPAALIACLRPGGRLITPIGAPDAAQRLLLVTHGQQTWLDDVLFVPGLPGIA